MATRSGPAPATGGRVGGRPRWWLWLVPTWLLLAWLFQGVLRGEALFQGDSVLTFYPLKRYLADALARGALPEWWPFDSLGQPLTSLPIASTFHPTTLLYLLLPADVAWSAQTMLSVLLWPTGVWFLARTIGLRPPAAAATTLWVSVSFWNVHLATQTQMHLAALGLPWFWREGLRLFRSRRGSPLIFSLATANLVLGGDPMLLEIAAVGLLPLLRWERWRRPRAWARLAGAGSVGVGLGAVQLVPMLLHYGESPRSAGLNVDTTDFWALRIHHLWEMVMPAHYGSELLFDTVYVGLPLLLFAALGALRPWRFRWPLLLLAVVLVGTAFGRAGPLWAVWDTLLPGWRAFQFPVKTLGPALLPLGLLAGRGLQASGRRWLAWPALAVAGVALWWGGHGTALLLAGVGVLGALLERRARAPGGPPALTSLAAVVMVVAGVDLALQLEPVPTVDFALLRTPSPLVEALRKEGVSLETGSYSWSWSPPEHLQARVADWSRRDTALAVLLGAPNTGAVAGLPTTMPYLAGITRRTFDVARADARQQYLWRKQLSHVFGAVAGIQKPGKVAPENLLGRDDELGAIAVRHPDALPRAYVAFAATPVEESRQVQRLNEGLRAGYEVLVRPKDVTLVPELGPEPRPHQRVEVHRRVDVIEAELELAAPGVLVINEALAAGWEASVNGAPAKLLAANHAVMGLELGTGSHRVVLTYSTPGLALGGALTLLSGVLLAAWVRSSGRRRRPTRRGA